MAEQLLTAEVRADWAEALDEFEAQAWLAWDSNKTQNKLDRIIELLEECDCEDFADD